MQARPGQRTAEDENWRKMKAILQSADAVIAAHFSEPFRALPVYGGLVAAYALITLAYYQLRLTMSAPKATRQFKMWAGLAKKDTVTKSFVASRKKQDYRFSCDPCQIVVLRNAARDFIEKNVPNRRIEGCSAAESAYAMIVLAYKTLRLDLRTNLAESIFDTLAWSARRDVDAERERL